jgi:hypothetical protein
VSLLGLGQDGAVTFAFEGIPCRCIEQRAGLFVTERRREAFIAICYFRSLYTLDGIVHHGVAFVEIFKQGRDRGELAANGGAFASPPLQIFAPGNQMRTRHDTKYFRVRDACEAHEVLEVVLVGAPRLGVGDVGKPLDLRWHIGQVEKFLRAECASFRWDQGASWFFLVGHSVVRIRCQ